jgi:hypothetical protein
MLPEKFQQLTTTAEVTSFCSMNEVMRDNVICGTGMSDATITVLCPEKILLLWYHNYYI